jgi:hypothetical protein
MKLYRMANAAIGALKERSWAIVRGDANVPIPVDLFAALCGAWGKSHRRCKAPRPLAGKAHRPLLRPLIAESRRRRKETTPRRVP